MARAYDQFDNLIFQTEGKIMDDEDKKEFTKKVMDKFFEEDVSRMELFKTGASTMEEELENIQKDARESGEKTRKIFGD